MFALGYVSVEKHIKDEFEVKEVQKKIHSLTEDSHSKSRFGSSDFFFNVDPHLARRMGGQTSFITFKRDGYISQGCSN